MHAGKTGISTRYQRGNIAFMAAFALLPLLAAIGLATDSTIALMVKSRLQTAVDASGLAAGRVIFETRFQTDARKFFDVNFPAGWMGASVSSFAATTDTNKENVTIAASATVPTQFMRLFNKPSVTVNARNVTRRANRGMELALVMDNTGSMRSNGKIDAMKSSAQDLINILFGDNQSLPNFWVSLVPYSASVNMGNQNTAWLRANDRVFTTPSPFAPSSWKGCVMARTSPFDEDDTPPSVAPFTSYFYANDVDNRWTPVNEANGAQNSGTGPNLGCGPAITPLTSQKSVVTSAISAMQPWHRGGTFTSEGTAWGWRTLSPRWRGLWNTEAGLPLEYNTAAVDKVMVILTDGVNEVFDWPDHTPNNGVGPRGSDFTAYGRLNDFGFTSRAAGRTFIDQKMARICTSLKSRGVIIFTITFGSDADSAAQTLFRNCASDSAKFFNAPTNAQLSTAFRNIGQQLSNLRVVE